MGTLEVLLDGRALGLGRPKQRALLAVLLLDANQAVSVDRLIEELWGDEPPKSARHGLEVYVSGLRKVIGADRIRTADPGYLLRVEPGELDFTRFEHLLHKGRRTLEAGRAGAARETLSDALALWRGPPLAGVPAGLHIEAATARLEDLRLAALEARLDADLALGRHDELVPELERLVAEHPLRESVWGRLMLALYRCGRQADALAAYQSARRRLVDELGIQPSLALQELERAILNHDRSLEVPPSDASDARLPVPAASFVGRRRELATLRVLLVRGDVRLVTLTGPGGIGKTRLAIEAARTVEREWSHGAAFVTLVRTRRHEEVPRLIAAALGLREADGTSVRETLKRHLADKELLLVLDNFEHVLESATLLSELLSSCPELTVLVTSRAPLHIYGERELPVPPLRVLGADSASGDLSEAAQLFIERAQSVAARDARGAESAAVIEEICVRLDGIPLAIELAAARARVLSPKALLARMGHRLQLLIGGPRDAPHRHRTLRAAIEWSHDLLGAEERRAFARLAVFVGGFSLETAEAVCGASVDQITVLRDNGLLRYDAGDRFAMLETIREFAAVQLAQSGTLAEMRREHGEYFVALAERAEPELRGPGQLEWLDRLDAEEANLWAVFDWAFEIRRPEAPLRLGAALWRYWEARGSLRRARALIDKALADAQHVAPRLRARALFSSARMALRQGDLKHALTAFAAGEDLFRAAEDAGGIALCLAGRGWIVHSIGPSWRAVELCREAVELARSSGESWIVGDALNNLGVALRAHGAPAGSRAALEESLALRRSIGDLEGVTAALNGLALLAVARDDLDEAEAFFLEAFAISEARRDLFYDAAREVVLGYIAFARTELVRAETLSLRALDSSRRHGYLQFTAYALELLAGIAAAEGRLDDAAMLRGSTLAAVERLGHRGRRAPGEASAGVEYDWDARAVNTVLADARGQLGPATWDAVVDKGRLLDVDAMVEFALGAASRGDAVRVA